VIVSVQVAEADRSTPAIRFSVIDTGIGIPPEKHETIFQAFVQADGSISRRFGGTGLGLSICWQLVRMMGGNIWVESKVGKGSTFSFEVPLPETAPPHDSAADHSVVEQCRPLRVLVAEDNRVNQLVATKLLERMGHVVEVVADGAAAVERFLTMSFDIILMDVHMPGMSGLDAARSIREYEGATGAHIPIIALTASAMKQDHQRCIQAGMDDFLTKPFIVEELRRRLVRHSSRATQECTAQQV
jgi:CheY-like chemotaxis protein